MRDAKDDPAGTSQRGASDSFANFVLVRPGFLSGFLIVGAIAAVGLLAPLLPIASPVAADAGAYLLPPNPVHPFGTDGAGLDVFSRVLHAPRVDLPIAVISTLLAALVGCTLGALAGMWEGRGGAGGMSSAATLRTADVVQAFPVFALALVLVAVMGQGMRAIVLAIGLVNIPVYLRLMRQEVLRLRGQAFVEAALIAGAGRLGVLRTHIVPNALAPILAQISINSGTAVLLTAGLSFIGAGVRAPTPEWGAMIAMGFQNIVTGQWWPSIFPGFALALTVFGFGRIGAAILAWSNPHERSRPTHRQWRRFLAARSGEARI